MTKARLNLVSGAAALYVLGLIAIQAHLLRYGILDLFLIRVHYIVIGFYVLATILPALTFAAIFECRRHLPHLSELTLGLAAVVLIVFGIWWWRFDLPSHVVDFGFYPYPRSYVLWNILWANLAILLVWSCASWLVRSGYPRRALRSVALIALAIVVVAYAFLFGRTIYPALSTGIGGGSPQFVVARTAAGGINCTAVHYNAENLYCIQLDSIPEAVRTRNWSDQLVGDTTSPIFRALLRNELLIVPVAKIEWIRIYSIMPAATIRRYLVEEKHIAP